MRNIFFCACLIPLSLVAQLVHPANSNAFLQNEVAKIYITMNPQDFNTMVGDSLGSNFEFPAHFIYSSSVVTDTIDRFTHDGISLESGDTLEADIIVSATGIELNALNDINVSIDGAKVEANNKLSYKGMMLSGVPNLAFSFGYVNASWTLRADLTCEYVCRLLNQMDKQGASACVPEEDPEALVDDDYIDFTSGYVQRALDRMPKQGKKSPWRNYQNQRT